MSDAKVKLAQWKDYELIASVILEELEENDIKPTLANARRVWLDALEEIHHLARSSLVGVVNRSELATVA